MQHQQVVALAGRGVVEVEIARTELLEEVLGNDGTHLHRFLALVEEFLQSHIATFYDLWV